MVPQTASRIGPPPLEDALPVWAWLQRQDSRRARPNLRCSAHLPSETQVVRPEIDVDANAALLSDFELWLYVLDYWYLPGSQVGADELEHSLATRHVRSPRDLPSSETVLHDRVTASWQRIFDLAVGLG